MVKIEAMFRYRSQVKYQYCIVHKNVCREVSEIRGRKRESEKEQKERQSEQEQRSEERPRQGIWGNFTDYETFQEDIIFFYI